jgi:hypothetical protein
MRFSRSRAQALCFPLADRAAPAHVGRGTKDLTAFLLLFEPAAHLAVHRL